MHARASVYVCVCVEHCSFVMEYQGDFISTEFNSGVGPTDFIPRCVQRACDCFVLDVEKFVSCAQLV